MIVCAEPELLNQSSLKRTLLYGTLDASVMKNGFWSATASSRSRRLCELEHR